jgi:hypothetical protein
MSNPEIFPLQVEFYRNAIQNSAEFIDADTALVERCLFTNGI